MFRRTISSWISSRLSESLHAGPFTRGSYHIRHMFAMRKVIRFARLSPKMGDHPLVKRNDAYYKNRHINKGDLGFGQ
jgi:hypothetical protein